MLECQVDSSSEEGRREDKARDLDREAYAIILDGVVLERLL